MSSERSIPHLRDIFGINGYTPHHHNNQQIINNSTNNGNGIIVETTSPTIMVDTSSPIECSKKQSRKKRDNYKTLTSGDVKTLERHLSMKKTIRKKIMRDLQQAFVDDPNEFKVENPTAEHMRAELKAETLRFGENPSKKSDNFLVMLRGNEQNNNQKYNNNNNNNSNSNNNNYEYSNQMIRNEYEYDSSNNNNNQSPPTTTTTTMSPTSNQSMNSIQQQKEKDEKQSFWKRFTMKNKNKR